MPVRFRPRASFQVDADVVIYIRLSHQRSHHSNHNTQADTMTFVVTEKCIRCKYTDCVEVCPVDCFYEGPNFLVINPSECIDCALCEPECPVNAIYSEDDLPEKYQSYLELNTELSEKWPNINRRKDAPPDADQWTEVDDKIQYLEKDWPKE